MKQMKINLLEYKNWLGELKQQIRNSQIKTALSVNKALIALYWDLGKQISEKQRVKGWGSKVVNQLSADLCSEFKGVTGFSRSNLYAMKQLELKVGEFEPEYLGKINFYLSAVDTLLKTEGDSQTIGILLCKNQNSLDVEFALRDINKPIGVSEFTFKELPATIQSQMPSEEELNNELLKFNHITNQ